ncbi:hypothetical protein ScPMuIL_006330 [Solemya velum]
MDGENVLVSTSTSDYIQFAEISNSTILPDLLNTSDIYDIYEYNYEYDPSANSYPKEEIVPLLTFYGLTLVVGLIGNCLVIFSICRYRRLRSITNIFLISLASADLLVVLICVSIKGARFMSYTWAFGEFLCKFVHYVQNVSMICSVMTLTAMSIERFVAILYPLRAKYLCTKSHAIVVLVIIWVLSVVMGSPILFGQKIVVVGIVRKATWCIKQWESDSYSKLYEIYMFIIIFMIPVAVMTIAYAGICRELWKVSTFRASMRTSIQKKPQNGYSQCSSVMPISKNTKRVGKERKSDGEDERTRKQVIQMLIVVVTVFVICWGPILINNLLVGFNVTPFLHTGVLKPLRKTFFLLCYLNSCMNPIIYAFMSKHFRESFKLTCLACFRRKSYKNSAIGMHRVTSRLTSVTSVREGGQRIYISTSSNRPR